MNLFLLWTRMSTGLILCMSFSGNHSFCELTLKWSYYVQKIPLSSLLPRLLDQMFFLSSLPQWSLSLRDRCDVDVPFVSEYSTDICYLHFGKLWVSVLTGSGSGGEEV